MELQLLVVVATLCYLLWTSKRLAQHVMLARIPGPPGHIVFGHLRDLLHRDYHRKFGAWSREYGTIFRINVMGVQGLVISEPRVIASLLGQDRGVAALPKLQAYQQLDMVTS